MSRTFRHSEDAPFVKRADTRRIARKVTEAMSRAAWEYMAETETAIRDTVRAVQGRAGNRRRKEG